MIQTLMLVDFTGPIPKLRPLLLPGTCIALTIKKLREGGTGFARGPTGTTTNI